MQSGGLVAEPHRVNASPSKSGPVSPAGRPAQNESRAVSLWRAQLTFTGVQMTESPMRVGSGEIESMGSTNSVTSLKGGKVRPLS